MKIPLPLVAPYVGAWIETFDASGVGQAYLSHPTWVRGLKLPLSQSYMTEVESHPTWVRGLKRIGLVQAPKLMQSHPTWVRGLKHTNKRT